MMQQFGQFLSVILAALLLAACAEGGAPAEPEVNHPTPPTPMPSPKSPPLPDLGPAPDFYNDNWFNMPGPLNLAALRGKVVLVEFWTYG